MHRDLEYTLAPRTETWCTQSTKAHAQRLSEDIGPCTEIQRALGHQDSAHIGPCTKTQCTLAHAPRLRERMHRDSESACTETLNTIGPCTKTQRTLAHSLRLREHIGPCTKTERK